MIAAASLSENIKREALELGFTIAGIAPAVTPTGVTRLAEWLELGYAGQMGYLAARQEAYGHPRAVLEGVRSLVMLGLPYATARPERGAEGYGRISRYAWGNGDYHDLIHGKLKSLMGAMGAMAPGARLRGVVDTAPLLEREFAQLAGLGWIGKNTLLIHKPQGSYFFLAAVLTDLELASDEPFVADHCGTCRACLDACPTGAFAAPYVLDARRCISYLTIELREQVPRELRAGLGDWLFGCDVCQDVCPWNQRTPISGEQALQPGTERNPIELRGLFWLTDEEFRRQFRQTPLWRPRRRGILRTAAIILGNQRSAGAIPALVRGLADEEAMVRGAAAWGLGQIGGTQAEQALAARSVMERDEEVRGEIELSLATCMRKGAADDTP